MIHLLASNKEELEVSRDAIKMSSTISIMLEGPEETFYGDTNESQQSVVVPVRKVEAAILKKVIDWCEHYKGHSPLPQANMENTDLWDEQFLDVDKETLFKLIQAASELDIPRLSDLLCRKIAAMIKDKSEDEILDVFTLDDSLTPEEEEEMRKEAL